MVVALGTLHGQSHPYISCGFNPVDHIFHTKFLGDHSTFIGSCMITIKTGCNFLGISSLGKKITGQLFDRKLVEGHIIFVSI